MIFIDVEI